jgi:hypothetical protein
VPAWPFVGGGHPIVAKLGEVAVGDSLGLYRVQGSGTPGAPYVSDAPRLLLG